mgnify:CR=1 FL=1
MQLNSWVISEDLKGISHLQSQEEQICNVLHLFEEQFAGDRISFYRFSPIGYVGEGIAMLENGRLQSINYIRDDIRSLHAIKQAVEKRKTFYYEGKEIIIHLSSRYQREDPLMGLLVVPIIANNLTIAYILSEFVETEISVSKQLLQEMDVFGKALGQLLVQPHSHSHPKLSSRESEIVRALANGLSTKEMTIIFSLSEATINQYIKSILSKLNAKNRTHAVSIYITQYL